jgi:anti-sigma B factor antagonist
VTGRLANLDFEARDGVLIAGLTGEIDMSNAVDVYQSLIDRITRDVLGVAIDLTGVRYLDSAGILMLFRLRSHFETTGQDLRLILTPGSLVAETLELVDVPGTIGVVDSTAGALAELAPSRPGS